MGKAKGPKLTTGLAGPDQHVSVSVRKIANGFVASHSRTGPKGDYQSTEYFHPKKPTISVSGMKPPRAIAGAKVAKPKRPKGSLPANGLAGLKL